MNFKEVLSGEQFQELCPVYCGVENDLYRNPKISIQTEKHMRIDTLNELWDNPSLLFCYSCSLKIFIEKLQYIKNPFVLVSHNEDTNITEEYLELLRCPLLVKWYAQNALLQHEKLEYIPIGIANQMWSSFPNIDNLNTVVSIISNIEKQNDFYFYFSVHTNNSTREMCKSTLEKKGLLFGSSTDCNSYLLNLASHKFAICPEGNGFDCHRTWECYYLGVIPILLENTFTVNLQKQFPCVLLKSWDDFNKENILKQYDSLYKQMDEVTPYLQLSYYKSRIEESLEKIKSMNVLLPINNSSMNIVYSFTGTLPSYAVDTVYQTRLFYDGPIYFIVSDYENPLIEDLKRLNVIIIRHDIVMHNEFNHFIDTYYNKFVIMHTLIGREKLFIYSLERFFLLFNLMLQNNLENMFFMELDNLIYDNPINWLNSFLKSEISYMYDNYDRCSSGICFIKNTSILSEFCNYIFKYVTDVGTGEFITEMAALYRFYKQEEVHKSKIQFLPVHWLDTKYPKETYDTFSDYNSIFDAASIGIFIGGLDPYHTDGNIVVGSKGHWSLIDYTGYSYKWELDNEKRNIPYIYDGTKWLKINNLHIHSKNLKPYISRY